MVVVVVVGVVVVVVIVVVVVATKIWDFLNFCSLVLRILAPPLPLELLAGLQKGWTSFLDPPNT